MSVFLYYKRMNLHDNFKRLKDGIGKKYDDLVCELSFDGCGSYCQPGISEAMRDGVCGGCIQCSSKDCRHEQCNRCSVRCFKRKDILKWITDIDGFKLTGVSLKKQIPINS